MEFDKLLKSKERYHNFEFVTYIPLNVLQALINDNSNITNYAYAYHDKDFFTKDDYDEDGQCLDGKPKAPHYHLLVNLKNAQTLSACLNRFSIPGFTTRIFPVFENAKSTRYEYLWHLNDLHKFQYDKSIVFTNNENFWLNCGNSSNEKVCNMIEDINSGKSFRYMMETYGRDYILNRSKYESFAYMLKYQESEIEGCLEDCLIHSKSGEIVGRLYQPVDNDLVEQIIALNRGKKS